MLYSWLTLVYITFCLSTRVSGKLEHLPDCSENKRPLYCSLCHRGGRRPLQVGTLKYFVLRFKSHQSTCGINHPQSEPSKYNMQFCTTTMKWNTVKKREWGTQWTSTSNQMNSQSYKEGLNLTMAWRIQMIMAVFTYCAISLFQS